MELLLTVLTLLATVYALLPRDRRLDLSLKIRPFDWFDPAMRRRSKARLTIATGFSENKPSA
jgi:hypothetical protein